jgi:tryptophan halogenase
MDVPDSLQKRIDFFKKSGGLIPGVEELFQPTSWYAVFDGMGIVPENYNSTLDALDYSKLKMSLDSGKKALVDVVKKQPTHDEFLQQYCPAPMPKPKL